MSRLDRKKPSLSIKKGGELSLSSASLADLSRAVLEKNAKFRFRAKGFSMSPFIKDGDVITIAPVKNRILISGDIVAFENSGEFKFMVHRIIKILLRGYMIKGDNLIEIDGAFPKASILGIVVDVRRHDRNIRLGIRFGNIYIALFSRWRCLTPALRTARRLLRWIRRF